MDFEVMIGVEVHAQLLTKTKIFCGCSTNFGRNPNTQVCPICLGMPGVLPVLNQEAVELAIRAALALHCKILRRERFARKGYFYPDLPKGYQISQYEEPFAAEGILSFERNGNCKTIRIKRMNLEEDAGKLIHEEDRGSLVDFNRCGVPLLEIATEPDLTSPKDTHTFLAELRQILQYLEVSSGDMEKGHLRCEPNISLKKPGQSEWGTRTELKNLNSLKGVEKGLLFEIRRQKRLLESGQPIRQETLLWDEKREIALPMRVKEEAGDYRYFPEPDLVPLVIDEEWIERVKRSLPELPDDRKKRFVETYKIREQDAQTLTLTRRLADYFEEVVKIHSDFTLAANWIITEVLGILHEKNLSIGDLSVTPARLAGLFHLIQDETISKKMAKEIFVKMVESGKQADEIVRVQGGQIRDEAEVERIIEEVLKGNSEEKVRYQSGEVKLMGYFIGQVMKRTDGKANPRMVNEILRKMLEGNPQKSGVQKK
ncbi:Asp-tRNA(Asn)/Glu-tRNA(Gln) amidotransferase subunit GatB [candidate division TA06 bacterium]|nr:Asp-tRNA(Asn)/Glu-tRNA(Gln) amidotransferase subunit GatB [candidate division TA06 bacterium]